MKKLIIILVLFSFVGCGKIGLRHELSERQASEILTALHQNGIDAEKEREIKGQDVTWKILVKKGDVHVARQILVANNLPRREELGLSGVYKEKGLIPTPDEQRARFLLALKGEIINSLERIPGVVDVDVVLNVPSENEFAELATQQRRPTASVVVRTTSEGDVVFSVTEGKIQRFVANTIPSLNPNDVAVIITRMGGDSRTTASTGSLFPSAGGTAAKTDTTENEHEDGSEEEAGSYVVLAGIRVARGSVKRMKIIFISFLVVLVFIAGALLFYIIRLNRMKVRLQKGAPIDGVPLGEGGQQLLGEGQSPQTAGAEGTFDVKSGG